ncbi:hypothetical protein Trydic_g6147 [Trypoxylus dichotomus]
MNGFSNRLDIILFGATGFTGRSEADLKNVLSEIQQRTGEDYSKIPIIQANVEDVKSIEEMTAAAKVIINCVGPYTQYGEVVVQACIQTGTHQIDICGASFVEPQYIEDIQKKYHQPAKEKGVYIVSGCAIDSMAADLGAILIQKKYEGNIDEIESHLCFSEGVSSSGPIANYGTYDSFLRGFGGNARFRDFLKLCTLSSIKDIFVKRRALNAWYILFPASDQSLLNKTQKHMNEVYGQKLTIVKDYLGFSKFGEFFSMILMAPIVLLLSKCDCGRNSLRKHPRFFSCGNSDFGGPGEQAQKDTEFRVVLVGKGSKKSKTQQKKIIADVSGKDPYALTCTFAVISAIMILTESHKMPDSGGHYSPGAAFANTCVVERLEKYGFKFDMNSKIEL